MALEPPAEVLKRRIVTNRPEQSNEVAYVVLARDGCDVALQAIKEARRMTLPKHENGPTGCECPN